MSADMLAECRQAQQDEIEVLRSILDSAVTVHGSSEQPVVQVSVKSGNSIDDSREIVLEFALPASYPLEAPAVLTLEVFANKSLMDAGARAAAVQAAQSILAENCGSPVIYTVVEWFKENFEGLVPAAETAAAARLSEEDEASPAPTPGAAKPKRKPHLTKKEKARAAHDVDFATGERPRGWNWVDILGHLAKV